MCVVEGVTSNVCRGRCQSGKVLVPGRRCLKLRRQHAVWQAGLVPKVARIGPKQLRQRHDNPLIAGCLAVPQLCLIVVAVAT